jgi:hypothetical protein
MQLIGGAGKGRPSGCGRDQREMGLRGFCLPVLIGHKNKRITVSCGSIDTGGV